MAEADKPAKPAAGKTIIDVTHADKAPTSGTSKPVLVSNRPIMKDPMVVEDSDASTELAPASVTARSTTKSKIEPLVKTPAEPEEPKPEEPEKAEEKTETEPETEPSKPKAPETEPEPDSDKGDEEKPSSEAEEDAEAAKQAEHDASVQKLVDSKQYFLPINSVEKRRSKRFVAAGILLSLLLAMMWVDVALDAGLIHLSGIKPVTHFFSN